MLSETQKKLETLYAGGCHLGTDGHLHEVDTQVRIGQEQGQIIAALHGQLRPTLSVEIGLAYGFSTLFILDSMRRGQYGRHIAIDPGADYYWHGIGLQAVKETGLSERFTWIKAPSHEAFPQLLARGDRAQFVYIDGAHLFDYALVDFFLSDKILDIDGLIVFDDLWLPAIKRLVSFVSTNAPWYRRIDANCDNLAVFKKVGSDARAWDHFEDF
jgi:predicted O-methyltransferase YrrM